MTTDQKRARRRFRHAIEQRQRAIVRAPKGGKLKAWAELQAFTTELLRQRVEQIEKQAA